MEDSDDLQAWIQSLKDGDTRAAEAIWREYFEKLVVRARKYLGGSPRRDHDEEDIALSAMHSLVRGARHGRFPQLNDRSDLWRILLTITARKASKGRRRRLAAKRGGGHVRGESVFLRPGDSENSGGIGEILGKEPSPELAAELAENCRQLMERLGDPALEQIVAQKLEGMSNVEIAYKLGCATRTVERKLEAIRKKWQDPPIA
jgi:RNA polymerase sigma factor (sigma-70 family)